MCWPIITNFDNNYSVDFTLAVFSVFLSVFFFVQCFLSYGFCSVLFFCFLLNGFCSMVFCSMVFAQWFLFNGFCLVVFVQRFLPSGFCPVVFAQWFFPNGFFPTHSATTIKNGLRSSTSIQTKTCS